MAQPDALKIICRNCRAKYDVTSFEPFSQFACPECGTILRVPRKFGKYQLEKVCGRGGMASVYRAIDPEFSRYVAVKIMSEEAAREPELVRHFIEQAHLVSRIDHPGIIPIYESDVLDGEPYLVMKYMDGGSFELRQKENRLPELPTLLTNIAVVSGGLQAALQAKVIHHDIKPGNILSGVDGSVGLGDFDLAECPHSSELQPPREWASPAYVSPEWLETGEEDFRGDIFSLGVTSYELLTGQIPYATDGDADVLLDRRRHPVHLPAADLNTSLSTGFSDFLARMMAFRPEDRPPYSEIIREFQQEGRRIADLAAGRTSSWRLFGRR